MVSSVLGDDKSKRVFIVHGRGADVVSAVSRIVRSMGLAALDFSEVRSAESFRGRYIGEVLDHAFDIAQAIVVLLSGEETVRLRYRYANAEDFPLQSGYQPRPNVLIETGMALRVQADRVVILEFPPLRSISDLAGIVTLRFDGDEGRFVQQLAAALRRAGCSIAEPVGLKEPILQPALCKPPPTGALVRSSWRMGVLMALALVAASIVGKVLIQPNWCGAACQEATTRFQQGNALWQVANSDPRYLDLYAKALDQYYKAMHAMPDHVAYRASVAATLNDLGEYDRTIREMAPFTQMRTFRPGPGGSNWLLGEIAAAYALMGDAQHAEQYTQRAADSEPHLRDWVGAQVKKYRQQDDARRQRRSATQ